MNDSGETCRVKILCASTSDEIKSRILSFCVSLEIKVIKLLNVADGFILFCVSRGDADKLFTGEGALLFSGVDAELVMPREVRANRSVLVFRVDNHIFNRGEDAIKIGIESENNWCKVLEVHKFKNSNGMKLVFCSSRMADDCMIRGLSLFQLHIPSRDMKKENYRRLLTCYTCYKIDDHFSRDCPSADGVFKVCSNCASHDHTWRECSSSVKCCINCKGNHNALSDSCVKRRELMKVPSSLGKRSYAETARAFSSQSVDSSAYISKTVSCIMLASMKAAAGGSFHTILNKLLTLNNLSQVKTGDIDFSDCFSSILAGSVPRADSRDVVEVSAVEVSAVEDDSPGVATPDDSLAGPMGLSKSTSVVSDSSHDLPSQGVIVRASSRKSQVPNVSNFDDVSQIKKLKVFGKFGTDTSTYQLFCKALTTNVIFVKDRFGKIINNDLLLTSSRKLYDNCGKIIKLKAADYNREIEGVSSRK